MRGARNAGGNDGLIQQRPNNADAARLVAAGSADPGDLLKTLFKIQYRLHLYHSIGTPL